MISAVIVDDEEINISNLEALLKKYCPVIDVCATAATADSARTHINRHQPDVVFLDIEMTGENGFDLLKSLSGASFDVVFVSAYDSYGIKAVKFSALDYLLKPIDINELKSCVQRIEESVRSKKINVRLNNLLTLLDKSTSVSDQKIALPVQKETHLVAIRDIIRCESSNNYTRFFLTNGKEYLISKPIYEYDELLTPYGFIRSHQSHLVNRMHVTSIVNEDSGYLVVGEKSIRVPISRQKKSEVKKALQSRQSSRT